jgi:hypothetical protein
LLRTKTEGKFSVDLLFHAFPVLNFSCTRRLITSSKLKTNSAVRYVIINLLLNYSEAHFFIVLAGLRRDFEEHR